MGYRSQVRIAISKKGYKEMCNYLVDYAKRIGFNKEAILATTALTRPVFFK